VSITPDFKVEVNGKDVTANVKKHLVSLSLKDESGDATDELTLNFDNLFKRPKYKDKIKVWLGYRTGLYYCGSFLVQTTEKNQNSLRVRATSTNFTTEIKKKRNRSYENISLCDLIKKIADRNGLKYRCNFNDVFFKHLAQTDESDLNLLNRIAKMYNATFNIKNDTIIFVKKQSESDNLPIFEIDRKDVSSYSIKYANKTLYKSVKAVFHDTKENKVKEVVFGSGEPQYVLQDTFKDESEALKRAEGIMDLLNSGIKSGNLTMDGMNIIAGAKLKLNGFGEDDGEYSIKRVTHSLNGSGYTVRVEFEK